MESILKILIINNINKIKDSIFVNNELSTIPIPSPGFGTIYFAGSTIFLNNMTFKNNSNSRGAALYIDGFGLNKILQISLQNIVFESNTAYMHGGGFYFSSNFWDLHGSFVNISCKGNNAKTCY